MISKRIIDKFNILGSPLKPEAFCYMRLIVSFILFLGLFFLCDYGYIIAPLSTLLYYFGIEYFILDLGIKWRILLLEKDSLEFMPLFLLALNNSNNVKKALCSTTEIINNSLSLEFKKVLNEVNIGKSLDEALNKMRERIPSACVDSMILSIIEANRVGNNIDKAVKNQLNNIENKCNKKLFNNLKFVPYKIAFASILFVFIILLFLLIISKYL